MTQGGRHLGTIVIPDEEPLVFPKPAIKERPETSPVKMPEREKELVPAQ